MPVFADSRRFYVTNYHVHAIVTGDGGNIEGLYQEFIDVNPEPYCTNVTLFSLPSYMPTPTGLSVITFPASFNNSFCPQSQPDFSTFRDPAFGSGVLEAHNATHMEWTWYRTIPELPEVVDNFMMVKDANCSNQYPKSSDTNASPAVPGGPASSAMAPAAAATGAPPPPVSSATPVESLVWVIAFIMAVLQLHTLI